ncbi:hypothetical protein AAY473_006374 [Plecturocebus cupreus]
MSHYAWPVIQILLTWWCKSSIILIQAACLFSRTTVPPPACPTPTHAIRWPRESPATSLKPSAFPLSTLGCSLCCVSPARQQLLRARNNSSSFLVQLPNHSRGACTGSRAWHENTAAQGCRRGGGDSDLPAP